MFRGSRPGDRRHTAKMANQSMKRARHPSSGLVHRLVLRPDFAAAARQEYVKWYDSEVVEQLIEGLRKAGLVIPDEPSSAVAKPTVNTTSNAGAGLEEVNGDLR